MSAITHLFAGVPVSDLDASIDWYTRLFGRPPDIRVGEEILWEIDEHATLFIEPRPTTTGEAVAWVCEESGDGDDPYWGLGVFSAHVKSDELKQGFEQGPQRVPVDEAIAWARARASKVIVRCCETWENTFYSAGDERVLDEHGPMPVYPEDGLDLRRRRLPGWEHLDLTEDADPSEWEVIVGSDVLPQPSAFDAAFEQALRSDSSARVVAARVTAPPVEEGGFVLLHGDTVRAHMRVTARTAQESIRLATAACRRAAETALTATSRTGPDDHVTTAWQAEAYPVGSRAAAANARIDQHGTFL
jgi:catechol 2,3-dioxygenase-like lactoylglutathione lyase family enzyme